MVVTNSSPGVPSAAAEEVAFSSKAWTIQAKAHKIETIDGRETLLLQDGRVTLDGVEFLDGMIEFDIMVVPERGFSGVRWRIQDPRNYEDFYIRPHQSGNEDANQYQPVFNGVAAWQIYYGPQFSVPVEYPFGEWIHIRLEVRGDRAQVFINDDTPSLIIDDLKRDTVAGAIGLASGFAAARFAGFRYEKTADLQIAPRPHNDADRRLDSPALIREWQVSDAIPESRLANIDRLDAALIDGLTWHVLQVESNGIANLARIQTNRDGKNTAFARLVLEADQEALQRLDFGFSDRVRVFVNGRLLFSASDLWQSRDYRFLGTVGLYDAVYCPLNPGRNEVLLAISESFGGWAVAGELDPAPGVRLLPH
jgi:hypothetical protein